MSDNEKELQASATAIHNAVRRKPRQLPWPRSVRLPDAFDAEVTRYLERNRINFNQLCAFALEKFIRERQLLELIPVGFVRGNATPLRSEASGPIERERETVRQEARDSLGEVLVKITDSPAVP